MKCNFSYEVLFSFLFFLLAPTMKLHFFPLIWGWAGSFFGQIPRFSRKSLNISLDLCLTKFEKRNALILIVKSFNILYNIPIFVVFCHTFSCVLYDVFFMRRKMFNVHTSNYELDPKFDWNVPPPADRFKIKKCTNFRSSKKSAKLLHIITPVIFKYINSFTITFSIILK